VNLYTIGDSFTYGDELPDRSKAWPCLVAEELGYTVDNLAQPGASNDYIVRTTVEYLDTHTPDLVIIAWTTPDRLELNAKHCTPNTTPSIFREWDDTWAKSKYNTQVKLLDSYIQPTHLFCTAWDHPITSPNYIGRFVEWAYGTPQGPGGHPLELGHRRIADEILRNIRH
jgi:lysophospholipase L1-like esterase